MDSIEKHPMIRASYPTWLTRRANRNLETWGVQDIETLGLAVAEECGELCQAILQARHEGGDPAAIAREAIDLGALCLQVLLANAETHGPANCRTTSCGSATARKPRRRSSTSTGARMDAVPNKEVTGGDSRPVN